MGRFDGFSTDPAIFVLLRSRLEELAKQLIGSQEWDVMPMSRDMQGKPLMHGTSYGNILVLASRDRRLAAQITVFDVQTGLEGLSHEIVLMDETTSGLLKINVDTDAENLSRAVEIVRSFVSGQLRCGSSQLP